LATFKAVRIDKAEKGTTAALAQFDEAELMDGDVTVAVEWSTVNYKDGLALTGKSPVVRRFPMIAGIDFAGTVEQSSHPAWKAGRQGRLHGWGMGETHLGAYAEKARVKGDWLVRLPDGMTARDAMAIGTAGYTAMLSVMALEKHGLTPKSGPVVVTGAAGGVGSVAIAMLSKLGFHVIASTGRASEADYLRSLGAAESHRSQRTVRSGQAARQGALGGRRRQRRLHHAGQPAVDDAVRRGDCRLRSCGRYGSAVVGRAVHFARSVPFGHRFRDVPDRAAQGCLGTACEGSRSRKTC
jgi:putative YhdH/YhfP family quinone oxidoreductase